MQRENRKNRGKSAHLQAISKSQNFLTSRRLLERIVRKSTISRHDTVLEIGAGKGHLTEALCRKAGYVYSVEIDRKLYERAKERLQDFSNIKIVCGDFMKYRLPNKGDYKVFANIPYNLTTKIVKN